MPQCKNDRTRTYAGSEPSPRGLGFCANAETIGKRKRGRDGRMWVVKKRSNGVRAWVVVSQTARAKRGGGEFLDGVKRSVGGVVAKVGTQVERAVDVAGDKAVKQLKAI